MISLYKQQETSIFYYFFFPKERSLFAESKISDIPYLLATEITTALRKHSSTHESQLNFFNLVSPFPCLARWGYASSPSQIHQDTVGMTTMPFPATYLAPLGAEEAPAFQLPQLIPCVPPESKPPKGTSSI